MGDQEIKMPEEVTPLVVTTPWQVVVTNLIGIVHSGEDEKAARKVFISYAKKSALGYGSVGHEVVTLMKDGIQVDVYNYVRGKEPPSHFTDDEVEVPEGCTEET